MASRPAVPGIAAEPAVAPRGGVNPIEVALLDRDGVIVSVNQAWNDFCLANGGEPGRCGVGVSYLQVCRSAADATSAEVAASIGEALRGDAMVAMRIVLPCHSPGEKRWFDLLVSSRLDEHGECVGATVVLSRAAEPSRGIPAELVQVVGPDILAATMTLASVLDRVEDGPSRARILSCIAHLDATLKRLRDASVGDA